MFEPHGRVEPVGPVLGHSPIPQKKKSLRNHYSEVLSSLGFHDLIEKSARLSQTFFDFAAQNAPVFSGRYAVSFCPFENEPQINIERESRTEPYSVAYVRIENWESREMNARVARRDTPDLWEDFELKNGNRVFQPKVTQALCESGQISMILVPAVAFTREGARLGRGAGFYDRFLKAHPEALRVGVAFEEQIATDLPEEPWDERMDIVLTDRVLYTTKNYGQWQIQGKIVHRNPT
jgi:5-formyltetrahydrofolate cyclo-ligase